MRVIAELRRKPLPGGDSVTVEKLALGDLVAGRRVRHYKSGVYEIVTLARDEETGAACVVYRGDNGDTWVRPLRNFLGDNDAGEPRFRRAP